MKQSKLITTLVCGAFITLTLSMVNLAFAQGIKANDLTSQSSNSPCVNGQSCTVFEVAKFSIIKTE